METHSNPQCADLGMRRIICASNWHSQIAGGEGVGAFVWYLGAPGGPCANLPRDVWSQFVPVPWLSGPALAALVLALALAGSASLRAGSRPRPPGKFALFRGCGRLTQLGRRTRR